MDNKFKGPNRTAFVVVLIVFVIGAAVYSVVTGGPERPVVLAMGGALGAIFPGIVLGLIVGQIISSRKGGSEKYIERLA